MIRPARGRTENKPAMGSPRVRRVLLVDDHPIVRQGLARLIGEEPDMAVCAEADDQASTHDAIVASNPDVAILDISLKDANGITLIKRIKTWRQGLPILVLSMHDESLYAERALRAGASGYVMKQEPPAWVIRSIRRVLDGDIVVSERMSNLLLQRLVEGPQSAQRGGHELLSDRELEVLQSIGAGQSTRQIAKNMHVSVKTVESHRTRIKQKLKLRTATQLVQYAIRWTDLKPGTNPEPESN